jgi:NtrC-family two-component system response regulator AlgB
MSQTPANATPLSILIVDDELGIRKTLGICLESEGHRVTAVSTPQDALAEVARVRFDLVFLDIRLGTESGINLLPKLLEIGPWQKVVMITAHASVDSVVEAMRRGAFDYVSKPFTVAQILAAVRKVEEVKRLEEQVRGLQEQLQQGAADTELKSHSTVMERAIELAREVAPSEATVLLTGESGTGKGVLAKAIHSGSRRAGKPFGVVSCPALSPELLESELFGHAKGAFTSAVRQNPGRIAGCEGGTLFLDEIGDLPLALQPKLLRFIQDREYESVGESVTRRADVRVIAATNVDLAAAVRAGRFREDLYYRLDVIQIAIPPLRERPEDIPLLAGRFLAHFTRGKNIAGFTDEALSQLQAHSWPGNVRELRNVVERAAILCHGRFVEPKHLTLIAESKIARERVGDLVSLEQIEEAHIRRVLAAARSMEEAARILGIDTVTLWRRRKRYGL